MQDLSAIAGTVGALVGVVLGGWLTARSQRTLLKESQRQSGIQARESAYSDFLVANHWEAVDSARARLELLAGDRIPSDTWWKVHRSFMAIARVRATCGPGEVPDELVHAAATAEAQFIQAAREDLIRSGAVTQFLSERRFQPHTTRPARRPEVTAPRRSTMVVSPGPRQLGRDRLLAK